MRDSLRNRLRSLFGPSVKIESERACLWAFDPLPLLILLMSLVTLGTLIYPFLIQVLGPTGTGAVGCLGLVLCFSFRTALVITSEGAFGESSVMGVVYRRVELGRHPQLEFGLVWDWSEISVSPTESHVDRSVLHDQDRFVVFEYHHVEDQLYLPLVKSLQREIERLHGVPQHDGWW